MKKLLFILMFIVSAQYANAQRSCSEWIDLVTSESYGTTYYSFDSDAVSQITFYEISDDDYNNYYFAIVKFTSSFTDYIYQVGSDSESNYSFDYLDSAGKAFWKHIEPYNDNLNCAPSR